LLAVLRDAEGTVHRSSLDAVWADEVQRARCLASLVEDGLVAPVSEDTFALP
jgi:A/G-specific adenine glycosylase